MSYININEVDKTVQDLAANLSDNIVYVPLNASDGPSNVYNIVRDYGDFVAMYGPDPEPDSSIMTSWEFAANLLLKKMPVMVRRITRKIDENTGLDMDDKDGLLTGASLAAGILKVKDILNLSTNTSAQKEIDAKFLKDTVEADPASSLDLNTGATNVYEIWSSAAVATGSSSIASGNGLVLKVNGSRYDAEMPQVSDHDKCNFSQGGGVSITNTSETDDLYITHFENTALQHNADSRADLTAATRSSYMATDFGIENAQLPHTAVSNNGAEVAWGTMSLAALVDNVYVTITKVNADTLETEIVDKSKIEVVNVVGDKNAEECIPAIKLPAGYTLRYSLPRGDSYLKVNTYNFQAKFSLEISTLESEVGANTISFATQDVNAASMLNVYATESLVADTSTEDIANTSEYDKNGYINLLKMYYKYIGSNGSNFAAALQVTKGDGIYLKVFCKEQQVEVIRLVNFRYKNKNGKIAYYDLYMNRNKIWELFLNNFPTVNGTRAPLHTNYLTIELGDNIDANFSAYLDSIYTCKGDVAWTLTGGSNPTSDCIQHEVHKTYAPLADKYLYDIKFVSNGAFVDPTIMPEKVVSIPVIDENIRFIEDAQVALAEKRGDCLAFLDMPMDLSILDTMEYYNHLSTSYATAYAPWIQLDLLTKTRKWCPPSFAALWTIAESVANGSPVYAPPAGVNRAHIKECSDLMYQVPSDYIDTWQDNQVQFVNPIIYINGYGVNIFGQKTLYNKIDADGTYESALQNLNVRLVANEVKKKIFKSCIELTFEYNNLHTWLAFKSKMSQLLDTLLYNHAITWYDVVMDETTMTDRDIRSNHIVGIVSIAVSNVAEKFDITFELLPNQVNFISVDYSTPNDSYATV